MLTVGQGQAWGRGWGQEIKLKGKVIMQFNKCTKSQGVVCSVIGRSYSLHVNKAINSLVVFLCEVYAVVSGLMCIWGFAGFLPLSRVLP